MMNEKAIVINSVSKDFRLNSSGRSTLKSLFTGLFKSKEKNEAIYQHALNSINLEINKGEFFGIVGRNGSGKSTLLKIIAGIYQPSSGSVIVDGSLVPFIELGVGFNPELTGKENIYLNGAILGFNDKEIKAFYEEVVAFAELQDHMDKKLKNYSSGMQVRLAFSLAVRADADILLIDEVLAVGDAAFQKKCYDYFFQLKKANKTVVFISHNMNAIKTYCDRAAVLDGSKIIYSGSVDIASEKYYKLFPDVEQGNQKNIGKERWGTGEMNVDRIITKIDRKLTSLKFDIVANRHIDNYILGYSVIDNKTNDVIFGQTFDASAGLPKKLDKNNRVHCRIDVPNLLRDGEYKLELYLHASGGIPVYDWVHGAALLKYKSKKESPYVIQPDATVSFRI